MNCDTCGAAFRVQRNSEGTARNVCACEVAAQTCARKKRGSGCGAVVQARLDVFDNQEVEAYFCRKHADEMLLDDGVPEAAPEPEPLPTITDPESREGFEVLDHVLFDKTRREAESDLKAMKHRVRCTDRGEDGRVCGEEHLYARRKLLATEGKRTWPLVCPKCGGRSYVCLE